MMAAMASRADCEGPSGFSLESMTTASGACGLRREAAASIGSVMTRKAAAADAAADRCRKERREKRGMRHLYEQGVYQRDWDEAVAGGRFREGIILIDTMCKHRNLLV